jgi:hypothetical protein
VSEVASLGFLHAMPAGWVQTCSNEFMKSQFAVLLVMRVHTEPWQFEILANGNADVCRTESLVSTSNEMGQRAGSYRALDLKNIESSVRERNHPNLGGRSRNSNASR